MGYSLEFYSLSWDALRHELAQPQSSVVEQAWRSKGIGPFQSQSAEASRRWTAAVGAISKAINSHLDGARRELEVTRDQAIAFVVMVRYLGSALGALDHASASGKEFRDDFLGNIASRCFQEPLLGTQLTERAFFGLISLEYPSWGGLTYDETRRLVQGYSPAAIDPAYSVWLDELRDILDGASKRENDVMTLYL
jgi:hypothetical protein